MEQCGLCDLLKVTTSPPGEAQTSNLTITEQVLYHCTAALHKTTKPSSKGELQSHLDSSKGGLLWEGQWGVENEGNIIKNLLTNDR